MELIDLLQIPINNEQGIFVMGKHLEFIGMYDDMKEMIYILHKFRNHNFYFPSPYDDHYRTILEQDESFEINY